MARHRAVALWVVAGAACVAGCGDDDESPAPKPAQAEASPDCPVGADREQDPIEGATLLGCATTQAGEVELWARHDRAGPCLVVVGLPGGPRGCGRAPSERVPPAEAALGGPAYVKRTAPGPLELYGETAPGVRRVTVSFRRAGGARGRQRATLIEVDDRRALRDARIKEPFGYFIATVPGSAARVTAEARAGASGRLSFDPTIKTMHPTAFILTE